MFYNYDMDNLNQYILIDNLVAFDLFTRKVTAVNDIEKPIKIIDELEKGFFKENIDYVEYSFNGHTIQYNVTMVIDKLKLSLEASSSYKTEREYIKDLISEKIIEFDKNLNIVYKIELKLDDPFNEDYGKLKLMEDIFGVSLGYTISDFNANLQIARSFEDFPLSTPLEEIKDKLWESIKEKIYSEIGYNNWMRNNKGHMTTKITMDTSNKKSMFNMDETQIERTLMKLRERLFKGE